MYTLRHRKITFLTWDTLLVNSSSPYSSLLVADSALLALCNATSLVKEKTSKMKATFQYSSILLLIGDNVSMGECLAHSCHSHIPLKVITLNFGHMAPITLAKHVHLQSPQELWLEEVSN